MCCVFVFQDLSLGSGVAGAPCRMLHPYGRPTEGYPGPDANHKAAQRQPRRLPEAQHAALHPRRAPRLAQVSGNIDITLSSPCWSKQPPPRTHLVPSSAPYSNIRECLKLDQDDKECFSHYKQVKKLSKQLDSAEELIQSERSVLRLMFETRVMKRSTRIEYPIYLQSVTRKALISMKRWWRRSQMSPITPTWPRRGSASAWSRWVEAAGSKLHLWVC